jgi:DNA-binding NtrC family response regulator
VLVTDVNLQDGDWKDFLSATAGVAAPHSVIVVTAGASSSFWGEVLNLGGQDVLEEPLEEEEVRRTVAAAIRATVAACEPAAKARVTSASSQSTGAGTPETSSEHTMNSEVAERAETRTDAILVVDDDPGIRVLLDMLLRADGYDVLLAENGVQAVDVFRQHERGIALVMLDWQIPGMNGGEVLDRLAAMRPDVRVIVCSGDSRSELIYLFRFTGRKVADFLAKRFTSKALAGTVRSVLMT